MADDFVDPYSAIGDWSLDYLHPAQYGDIQIHPQAAAHAVASIFAALHDKYQPLEWSYVSGQPMTVQDPVVATETPIASVGETPEVPTATVPTGETPTNITDTVPIATVPPGETPTEVHDTVPVTTPVAPPVVAPNYSEIGAQAGGYNAGRAGMG